MAVALPVGSAVDPDLPEGRHSAGTEIYVAMSEDLGLHPGQECHIRYQSSTNGSQVVAGPVICKLSGSGVAVIETEAGFAVSCV